MPTALAPKSEGKKSSFVSTLTRRDAVLSSALYVPSRTDIPSARVDVPALIAPPPNIMQRFEVGSKTMPCDVKKVRVPKLKIKNTKGPRVGKVSGKARGAQEKC